VRKRRYLVDNETDLKQGELLPPLYLLDYTKDSNAVSYSIFSKSFFDEISRLVIHLSRFLAQKLTKFLG